MTKRPLSVEEARTRFGRLKLVRDEKGEAMQVIRPESPALALAIARTALAKNDGALFDRLPEQVGRYTYRGLLGRGKGNVAYVVDEHGHIIEAIEPGDSFVTGKLEKDDPGAWPLDENAVTEAMQRDEDARKKDPR